MCFSAEASFGASAIILVIGIVSVKKSTTLPQKVLSCIPLFFSLQQFTEGVVWLSLSHPGFSHWDKIATYGFLLFAQVIWPVFLPFSVYLLEKDKNIKKIMAGLLVLGVIVSSVLFYSLLFYKVEANISCYHIQYDVNYPTHLKHAGIFYLIATIIPPIISSVKRLRLLGVSIFLSYIATKLLYENYLISVWCYFAAVISIVVVSVIIKLNRQPKTVPGVLPV